MTDKEDKIAVGFDVGTTTSCAAVWINDRVEIVPDFQTGSRTIPSYVSFTDNEKLVGEAAKSQSTMNPKNTVYDAKRLIGRKFSDPTVQADNKLWSFKVTGDKNDKPMINVTFKNEEKQFHPEEISAMVIGRLKESVEAYLGHPFKNVTVTVPAYFNDAQRQATRDAATIAGLNVLRIINEPTAAAIAYGLDKLDTNGKEKHIVIVDTGGGTHDISVLTLDGGIFEVKSTGGNTHLGGSDIDNSITDFLCEDIQKRFKKDVRQNARALKRLNIAAEKAKKTLTVASTTTVEVDSLLDGVDYTCQLSRAKFDQICQTFFEKVLEPLDQALKDAKMSKADIDDVIIVGGTTRIPKLQEMISNYFNGKQLNKSLNPDEAIAYGACVQSTIILGTGNEKTNQLLLLDVAPLSLGIETSGGIMTTIIPRNSTIPCKKSQIFSTYSDNQPAVDVKIYEGERQFTKDNHLLANFTLSGIPPAPRGQPQIEVTFDIDANGIMNITAVEKGSGKSKNITVTNDKGRLSKEQIEEMVKKAQQFKEEDDKLRENVEVKNGLENYLYNLKNSVLKEPENADQKSPNFDEVKKEAEPLIEDGLKWLDEHQNETTETYKNKQKELENKINPLMTKLYGTVTPEGMTPEGMAPGPMPTNGPPPSTDDLD